MVSTHHVGHVGVCPVDGAPGCAPAHSPLVKKNAAGPHAEQSDSLQDLARGWGAAECLRDSAPLLGSRARHTAAR